MGDPDPENCGWGKVKNLQSGSEEVPQTLIDAFKDYSGIYPTVKEPKFGGDGTN